MIQSTDCFHFKDMFKIKENTSLSLVIENSILVSMAKGIKIGKNLAT